MASEKQIAANRRNAQRSTGPVTEAGKAVAKFNALRHGMTADTAVLPYEDPHSYRELRQALIDHHKPVGAGEEMLVELIVNSYWRLLRARRVETSALRLGIHALKQRNDLNPAPRTDDDSALAAFFTDPNDNLRNMDRYHTGIERSYFRAVEQLRKAQNDRLREERRNAETHAKIGFVPKRHIAIAQRAEPQPAEPAPSTKDVDFHVGPGQRLRRKLHPQPRTLR